jgi:hypothetical protein
MTRWAGGFYSVSVRLCGMSAACGLTGCVSCVRRYTDLNSQVDSLKKVIETQSDAITTLETYLVSSRLRRRAHCCTDRKCKCVCACVHVQIEEKDAHYGPSILQARAWIPLWKIFVRREIRQDRKWECCIPTRGAS